MMNVKKMGRIPLWGPKKGLILVLGWLVVITTLHLCLNGHEGQREGKKRIRIGYLPITCHLLLPIAMERDAFFKDRVEPVKFSSWPDMIEAFKGGELQAAMILAPIAISMKIQGVPLKIALYGHRNGTGLVMARGLSGPSDLVGKDVAIPIRFSTQNLALLKFLERSGIPRQNVGIVELPPPDMPSAMAAKAISAYIVGEPYASQAELDGTGFIYCEADAIFPEFISSLLIVSESFLKDRKKEADRLITGLYEQGRWIEQHRKDAAGIGASFYGLSKRLLEHVLVGSPGRVRYSKLIPKDTEIEGIEQAMVAQGLLPKDGIGAGGGGIIYTGWLNMSDER
jgi:NitT/TauT family transport system substrate-binding protein